VQYEGARCNGWVMVWAMGLDPGGGRQIVMNNASERFSL
jgi:hypothetical protein